ncbi:hypothetical protein ACFYUY_01690 [Kitasatospora sp. NPDC004745]|uniref:hypothetical protein n=1 Tax=Kitasatospora sp. NPDC004745 TaxID=3364019 RepID=UPI0036BF9E12
MTGQQPSLAERIEHAISRGLNFAQADPDSVIPEAAAAVQAVVQPELDRRDAEIDRLRAELTEARGHAELFGRKLTDLLATRDTTS